MHKYFLVMFVIAFSADAANWSLSKDTVLAFDPNQKELVCDSVLLTSKAQQEVRIDSMQMRWALACENRGAYHVNLAFSEWSYTFSSAPGWDFGSAPVIPAGGTLSLRCIRISECCDPFARCVGDGKVFSYADTSDTVEIQLIFYSGVASDTLLYRGSLDFNGPDAVLPGPESGRTGRTQRHPPVPDAIREFNTTGRCIPGTQWDRKRDLLKRWHVVIGRE